MQSNILRSKKVKRMLQLYIDTQRESSRVTRVNIIRVVEGHS